MVLVAATGPATARTRTVARGSSPTGSAGSSDLMSRPMAEAGPEPTVLDADLQYVLMKLWLFLRRGDSHYLKVGGGITMAQLSILLTLLDQGPMRLASLAAHERLRAPTITVAIRR